MSGRFGAGGAKTIDRRAAARTGSLKHLGLRQQQHIHQREAERQESARIHRSDIAARSIVRDREDEDCLRHRGKVMVLGSVAGRFRAASLRTEPEVAHVIAIEVCRMR